MRISFFFPLSLSHTLNPFVKNTEQNKKRRAIQDPPLYPDLCVVLSAEEQLRSAVPSRDDVAREERSFGPFTHPGETQIADLQITVCVDEEVVRLQIAVQHIR